jgi:predicted metal-binding membrane protein
MASVDVARAKLRVDRRQAALIGLLLMVAAVAWLVTDRRMAGMDDGPGTDLGSLGFYVSAWVVMMAAMMLPSIAPMVAIYGRVQRKRAEQGQALPGATALFVAGYIAAWAAVGLPAYALFALARSLDIGALGWDEAGPYVAGAVLVGAAIYQLTPLKNACLSRCRSPLTFVTTRWRNGRAGATMMGIEHGAWCIGCCWALMASLFALGVMSIGWMVFVAALTAVEKLLPWKAVANYAIAVVLLSLGLAVAFVPERVPGLTIPGDAHGMDHGEMNQMDHGEMNQMDHGEMNEMTSP